ncbi:hypothetical protein ABT082_23470, partial [Streptomyces massasporeus]
EAGEADGGVLYTGSVRLPTGEEYAWQMTVDDATRAALRAQLTARAVHEGHALRTDPVLGELPFWHGPVTAHAVPTTAEEATDADH